MRRAVFLAIVLLAGLPAALASHDGQRAQAGDSISITVDPPVPTEADSVRITVAGSLPYPCFDVTSSQYRFGNTIVIDVRATPIGEACILVLGSFSVTEEIGKLPAGSYRVDATASIPCCYPCDPSPCFETATFEVWPAADSDGDGCTDSQEVAGNERLGGRRDPALFWDFFDTPPRDRAVSIAEIVRVVGRFGSSGDAGRDPLGPPAPSPAYHPAFDRTGGGAEGWLAGPANGSITIQDITLAVAQFGHSCGGEPARLRGEVVHADGRRCDPNEWPLFCEAVSLCPAGSAWDAPTCNERPVSKEGTFDFAAVAPGRHTIYVICGGCFVRGPSAQRDVLLDPGEDASVRVTLD